MDVTSLATAKAAPSVLTRYRERISGWRQSIVWFGSNPAAYDLAGVIERIRNLGFNTGRGPGGLIGTSAIHKMFHISEQHRMMFRFEMFNWLNHFIPGNPVTTLTDPNFGKITGAAANTTARNIQFALKYTF